MLVSVDNIEIILVPSLISEVVPRDWAFSNLPSVSKSKLSTAVANLSSDTRLKEPNFELHVGGRLKNEKETKFSIQSLRDLYKDIRNLMDGYMGYNQIRMTPEDEELRAFRTPKGLLHGYALWTQECLGLRNL